VAGYEVEVGVDVKELRIVTNGDRRDQAVAELARHPVATTAGSVELRRLVDGRSPGPSASVRRAGVIGRWVSRPLKLFRDLHFPRTVPAMFFRSRGFTGKICAIPHPWLLREIKH
jgi:hypothetical protein